jgi:hypothetical protein
VKRGRTWVYDRQEHYRLRLLRRTGKPHIYREAGVWLVLERTAPGEWWLSPLKCPQAA